MWRITCKGGAGSIVGFIDPWEKSHLNSSEWVVMKARRCETGLLADELYKLMLCLEEARDGEVELNQAVECGFQV